MLLVRRFYEPPTQQDPTACRGLLQAGPNVCTLPTRHSPLYSYKALQRIPKDLASPPPPLSPSPPPPFALHALIPSHFSSPASLPGPCQDRRSHRRGPQSPSRIA
jgi:hypothetical protein